MNRDYIYMAALSIATLMVSLWHFPKLTPDSAYYLTLVEVLKGTLPPAAATPPYCYRILMSAIVSVIPGDPILVWATISVVASTLTTSVVYLLVRAFNIGPEGALVGAGLTTVSAVTLVYGSWVGNDTIAMLFLSLSLLCIVKNVNASTTTLLLVVGAMFKEFVIIGSAVWILHELFKREDNSILKILCATAAIGTYILLDYSVRLIWTMLGVDGSWMWTLNGLWNFTYRLDEVINIFLMGLTLWVPSLVLSFYIGKRTSSTSLRPTILWFLSGTPFILYLGAGLFMAYFSLRFIWPLYLMMAPVAGILGDWLLPRLYEAFRITVGTLILLLSLILLVPLVLLAEVEDNKSQMEELS